MHHTEINENKLSLSLSLSLSVYLFDSIHLATNDTNIKQNSQPITCIMAGCPAGRIVDWPPFSCRKKILRVSDIHFSTLSDRDFAKKN